MPKSNGNIRVVLYGASVSAQSKVDSYWHHLKRWEANYNTLENGNVVDIYRLTYPSAFMGGAGVLNVDHLVALEPDIVVLDWLSTEEQDCDVSRIHYIYGELLSRGIYIITAALIRFDTWNKITPQFLDCFNISNNSSGNSFIDFFHIANNQGLNWDDITRDGVHTSVVGAKLYDDKIIDEIKKYLNDISGSIMVRDLSSYSKKCSFSNYKGISISSYSIPSEIRIVESQSLDIKIHKNNAEKAEIWCKQTCGPYTPRLDVILFDGSIEKQLDTVDLRDQWCHFERFAFKPLVLNIPDCDEGVINITFKLQSDNYSKSKLGREKGTELCSSKLRLHDRISAINCMVLGYEIK